MSRHQRPSDYSRGRSSRTDRTLSVTEASFQDLRLNETAGSPYLSVPPSYGPSNQRHRRPSYPRDDPYLEPEQDSNPSFPDLQPSFATSTYPQAYSFPSEIVSATSRVDPFAGMSDYDYSHGVMPPPYREPTHYTSRSSSQHGYSFSSAEGPHPRSMSGPPVPSVRIVPSSTYDEFKDVAREIARQRRQNLHQPRRENKLRLRKAMLPSISNAGLSKAEDLSGSIDCLTAHSTSSYDRSPSYVHTPTSSVNSSYGATLTGSSYPSYTFPSASGGPPMYTSASSSAHPAMVSPSDYVDYRSERRTPPGYHASVEPIVLQNAGKHRCFDHGCNGREFSTGSNLLRHKREKSGTSSKSVCHRCGADFTRKTARDGHLLHDKCKARGSSHH